MDNHSEAELWRLDRVRLATGLSRSLLYRMAKEDRFPKPVQLSCRTVAWNSLTVKSWIAERLAQSEHNTRGR